MISYKTDEGEKLKALVTPTRQSDGVKWTVGGVDQNEVEEVRKDEHLIWLDGEGGTPMGVIVQKAKSRAKKIS